jgi:linoleoyl-CoA desaturase
MIKAAQIKFDNKQQSDLLPELKRRINEYFESTHQTAQDSPAIYFKVVFWLLAWAITYGLVLSGLISGAMLFLVGFLHGLTHVFIAFNISHDANHNAISKNDKINRFLSYTLELIGVNSYLWRFGHNQEHHGYLNVEGVDNNIEGYGMFRFAPETPYKPVFKYQHIYAPFLYALSTINYVTRKDFILVRIYESKGKTFPTNEYIKMVLFKVLYYVYMLVIPILVLDVAWYWVVLCFLCAHFAMGLILTLTFLCGHLTENAQFPEIDEKGNLDRNWAAHVYDTTGDFAVSNPLVCWMVGSINVHIIHHLLPHVNHTHYRSLSNIIQKTAKDYNLPYFGFSSFTGAIISHFKFLKKMGEDPNAKV